MPDFTATEASFRGQPCLQLQWGPQDSVLVALHGAQVLSWIGGGRERLFDGQGAIRGGVPVCFPQFNERGHLPKHGFARNLAWAAGPARRDAASGDALLDLQLLSSPATQALWAADFEFGLLITLGESHLQIDLSARNTGAKDWSFTGALHTYLRVDDIAAVQVEGLDGQACWDALSDTRSTHAGPVRFAGEFDRVFRAAPGPLTVRDGVSELHITQSPSFADTVVWNPGPAKRLADMPTDGFAHMLCVEAAQVEQPLMLAPGASWAGWQRLALA